MEMITGISLELEDEMFEKNGEYRVYRKSGQIFWQHNEQRNFDLSGKNVKVVSGWWYLINERDEDSAMYQSYDLIDLDSGRSLGFRFISPEEAIDYAFNNNLEHILTNHD